MRKKNVRLDEGLALAHQTRKFGSPGAVALWVTLLVPFCFGIALAVLVEPGMSNKSSPNIVNIHTLYSSCYYFDGIFRWLRSSLSPLLLCNTCLYQILSQLATPPIIGIGSTFLALRTQLSAWHNSLLKVRDSTFLPLSPCIRKLFFIVLLIDGAALSSS